MFFAPKWLKTFFIFLALSSAATAIFAGAISVEPTVPLFDNLGKHHHAITTTSPLAQRYFDQGLRLVFAFNHNEAIAAFKQAAELDPNCAMCYWGIALAMGPNINLPMDLKQEPHAYESAQKARALAANATKSERAYIEALTHRYAQEPGANRVARDASYAQAMRDVAKRFPQDADAATLFAEALMDLQPWDYWTHEGQPKGAIKEIVTTLEGALKKNANHPGACHYYIHAVEASLEPQRALRCARNLPNLMPGAGHLVHMPAHVFMRLGYYAEAVAANIQAADVDHHYIQDRKPQGFYPLMYYPHNLHFLYAAASMSGQSEQAINAARALTEKVTPEIVRDFPSAELVLPTPLYALARFGKWDEILKASQPPKDLTYTTGIWHFTRGLAFAAKGELAAANAELDALKKLADQQAADHIIGLNSSKTLLKIASNVLTGEVENRQGQTDNAVRALREALTLEDTLTYDEPQAWYQPVRQVLGAILLAANKTADAENVYREDLKKNPENGWSLFGLKQSLESQQKTKDATVVDTRLKKAWQSADVTLTASRF